MRAFLLFVIVAVVVVAGVRLVRLRGDRHAGALSRAVAGETLYLCAVLGLLAGQADWLGWQQTVASGGLAVIGALLVRVAFAATAVAAPGPPRAKPIRPSAGVLAWYVAGLTLVIVVPVFLGRPAPRPPSPVEAAAEAFGGRIDGVLAPAETTVVERSGTPRVADAGVDRGEAVPVRQFRVDDRQVSLVVAHHLQCGPRAVVVARAGGVVSVAVVAAPAPNADALFGVAHPRRCAPDGAFTRRTVVNLRLGAAAGITGVTDAGAGGPAARVA